MDKNSPEYQCSQKGAKRSAELRREYANEKTREVIHDAITGCRIVIKKTVAFRYNGRRHALAIAASSTMISEDGIAEKIALWPEDFGSGKEAWYIRLEI